MKPWITGVAAVAAVFALYPSDKPLSETWSRALEIHASSGSTSDSATPLDSSLLAGSFAPPADSLAIPADPFGLPPGPVATPRRGTSSRTDAHPPPRPWRATGRVGELAAVLTSNDGRILVVKSGSSVDSATVVSIGNDGVVLEDRAGRFVLAIP